MSTPLEKLVIEWRRAQKAIDQLEKDKLDHIRAKRSKALDRLIAAHNALNKYIDEEMDS